MWIKRNDHGPKSERVDFFFNICTKTIVLKKNQLKPFPWVLLLFSIVFTFNFNKHGCNGGEEEEPYFALKIIHVLYMLMNI